jgi:hypothetical protein
MLSSHFATVETVHGTLQLCAFVPIKKGILNTKIYSPFSDHTENHVISVLKDITDFVTCMCV